MLVRIAVSLLLVAAAIALPGLALGGYTSEWLADTILPARIFAAPDASQPAAPALSSTQAQTAPSPMIGMMGTSSPMTGTMPMDMQNMGQMMQIMGMMMQMMGQMQGMPGGNMGTMGDVDATEPMTGTAGMMSGEMDMMGQMIGMMSQMQSMMGDMDSTVPMTGTVPMKSGKMDMMGQMMGMMSQMQGMMGGVDATKPMSGTMPMDMQNMGQMMQMMGMMMQMMGGMGMMGDVDATEPMTGTMGMMSGEMNMMAQMMGMMSQMQGMMGGTAVPVTATTPVTESAPSASAPAVASLLSQTVQAGAVGVTVQPLNLGTQGADTLDFEVTLETHSGSLDDDLSQLAVLQVGDVEVAARAWDAPSGGHHVEGILSFPAFDASGKPILAGATKVSLILRDLAGAGEQVLTWALTGSE